MAGFPKNLWSRPVRSPRPRRSLLRLEGYEDRTVPAVVNASVAGGVLTLTATDAASSEALVITPGIGPGVVHVHGNGATTISLNKAAAVADVDIKLVKSVSINLKGGADSASLQGVRLVAATFSGLPDGDKSFALTGGTVVGGNVSVTTGGGSDTLTVDGGARVGGSLTANLGKGGNNTVTIDGGAYIGGSVTLTGGAATDSFNLLNSTVGGNVKTTQSNFRSFFDMANSSVGGNLDVNLNSPFTAVDPPAGGTVTLLNSKVGGTAKVTGGKAADAVTVNDLTAGGKATFALGEGMNSLLIDADQGTSNTGSSLLGGLDVSGGTGTDVVTMGNLQPVLVAGPTTMNLGSETLFSPLDPPVGDTVTIDDTTFLDVVTINLGAGRGMDSLLIETATTAANVSTSFTEDLTVTLGGDNDEVALGTTAVGSAQRVLFAEAPVIDGGAGSDTLSKKNGLIDGTSITGLTTFYKNFEEVI